MNEPLTKQRRWYVVQTYSGFESSVQQDLERRIESMGMQDYIFQVMIPEETVEEKKNDGTIKTKVKKMYPGYVFVEMIVTDESWFVVRNTPKVTGFLGSSGGRTKPIPMPQEEIDVILLQIGVLEKPRFEFKMGEKVNISGGALSGQVGEISAINLDREMVTLLVEIFGRRTPTEVDFKHIAKR